MTDSLAATLRIAASGMEAQGLRLRVVAENVANAKSTSEVAGGDPYRRKVVTFEGVMDRGIGANLVEVSQVGRDLSDFKLVHDPAHPAADADGYVKMPNVEPLIEMMDMREATRSYEANLNMIEQARGLMARTLDLLRS